MKASVVDLRYRINDILKAIDRNEEVTILYHGKIKGLSNLRSPGAADPYRIIPSSTCTHLRKRSMR